MPNLFEPKYVACIARIWLRECEKKISEDFLRDCPKIYLKVPGTKMKFIAVEKEVPIACLV